MTRPSAAYVDLVQDDRVSTRLFLVGDDMPRTVFRQGANGLWICGTLLEPISTNRVYYSQQMNLWATGGSPTVVADDAAAPDGEVDADKITVTDTDYIYRTGAVGTPDAVAAAALWVKRVSTSNTLRISNSTGATKGDWRIAMSGLPDRWVRITRSSPYLSSVVAEFVNGATGACGLIIWSEDTNTVEAHVWQGQYEENATREATSDIETPTTAAVTRSADSAIRYINPLPNARQGWLAARVLVPAFAIPAETAMITLSADGAASDRVRLLWDTSGNLKTDSASTGGSAGSATAGAVADDRVHDVFCSWKPGHLFCAVDGRVGTPDTDVDISAGLNRLEIEPCGAVIANPQMGDRFRRVPFRRDSTLGG